MKRYGNKFFAKKVIANRKTLEEVTQGSHELTELITFDSHAEYYLARKLKKIDPTLEFHVPVNLIPQNEFYKEVNWKIDFFLPRHLIYVEYKGFKDRETSRNLKILASNYPQIFRRLVIVTPSNSRQSDETFNFYNSSCLGLRVLKSKDVTPFKFTQLALEAG